MSADPYVLDDRGRPWLPRNVRMEMTALEAGALMMVLHTSQHRGGEVTQPDAKGGTRMVPLVDLLLERLNDALPEAGIYPPAKREED